MTVHAVLTGQVIGSAFEAQVAPTPPAAPWKPARRLVPSFPGFHLYYPSRRDVTPALRAFIEAMRKRLGTACRPAGSATGRSRVDAEGRDGSVIADPCPAY